MSQHHLVEVIAPNSSASYRKDLSENFPIHRFPGAPTLVRKDVRFIIPNPLKLKQVFHSFNPDVLHLYDPSPANLILKSLADKEGVPVVFSHFFTPELILAYAPFFKSGKKTVLATLKSVLLLYKGSKSLVVLSNSSKNSLAPYTKTPIHVISAGIDFKKYSHVPKRLSIDTFRKLHLPQQPSILHVGRLDPEKNLSTLILAWEKLVRSNPELHLIIAGSGSEKKKLENLAAEKKINHTISWLGMIPENELPPLYNNPWVKAFVIPSPVETQSIVTLQALAASLPVVAANMNALPEIVHHGKTGFLCNPTKPETFARHIKTLIANPALNARIGKNGQKLAKLHDFALSKQAYLTLYKNLSRK